MKIETEFELLDKRDNMEIYYDRLNRFLYCNWNGKQDQVPLREAGEEILRLFREKKCSRVLNDNRHVVGLWYHSVDWARVDWFARMMEAGLTHFAWIWPEDTVLPELAGNRAIPADTQIVKTFHNYDEALAWLCQT